MKTLFAFLIAIAVVLFSPPVQAVENDTITVAVEFSDVSATPIVAMEQEAIVLTEYGLVRPAPDICLTLKSQNIVPPDGSGIAIHVLPAADIGYTADQLIYTASTYTFLPNLAYFMGFDPIKQC